VDGGAYSLGVSQESYPKDHQRKNLFNTVRWSKLWTIAGVQDMPSLGSLVD